MTLQMIKLHDILLVINYIDMISIRSLIHKNIMTSHRVTNLFKNIMLTVLKQVFHHLKRQSLQSRVFRLHSIHVNVNDTE